MSLSQGSEKLQGDFHVGVDFWRPLDLFFHILHQNLCLASSVHWGSPKGWCDHACAGWWIPHPTKQPGCGWAPEFVVEQCIKCLVSGSDAILLLLLDDVLNSLWFAYIYICIYNTHIHNTPSPQFLWFVSVFPYISCRQSFCTQGDVCAIVLVVSSLHQLY